MHGNVSKIRRLKGNASRIFEKAIRILAKYNVWNSVQPQLLRLLRRGNYIYHLLGQ